MLRCLMSSCVGGGRLVSQVCGWVGIYGVSAHVRGSVDVFDVSALCVWATFGFFHVWLFVEVSARLVSQLSMGVKAFGVSARWR